MTYNPDIHNRHSIRLKEYNYSENGMYFVTICVENREKLFGWIMNESIQLNNAGEMIQKWWQELENKYSNVVLDEFVIMPNHFHGIIQINTNYQGGHIGPPLQKNHREPVGVGLRVYPDKNYNESLSTIIQWFKTMTTNEYIRGVKSDIFPGFNKRIWQRDYYEHVIRDENDLNNIREYVINNPKNWENDSLFE